MSAADTARQLLQVNAQLRQLKVDESTMAAHKKQLILELVRQYKWPQKRVARVLGVSEGRISAIVNGKKSTWH